VSARGNPLFRAGDLGAQFLLWNVGSQVTSELLAPFLQALQAAMWRVDPNLPPSPAMLATLVAHQLLPAEVAADLATSSGVGAEHFAKMVTAASNGPDLTFILEAQRRGLLKGGHDEQTGLDFGTAFAQTGMRPEWLTVAEKLVTLPPTQEEALQGLLEGQIDRETALQRYLEAGGDPSWFQHAVDIRGQAPTPMEALEMANRRIIPWDGDEGPTGTSYKQAFLEGPWRNKWLEAFRKLGEYLPPPRTVTAMVRAGSLTDAQALDLFTKTGLSPELAAAYLADAKHQTAATDRNLTASQLIQLFLDQIIDRATVTKALADLRYSAQEAEYLVSLAEYRRDIALVNSAVGKVKALYEGHKIPRASAHAALAQLGVPSGQVDQLLTTWDLVLAVNVKTLTPAQIVDAWYLQLIGDQEALDELTGLGYTPRDAFILLSLKNKAPVVAALPAQDVPLV